MSIRLKIILVVLPLVVATLLLTGISSSYSARSGITRVAVEALGFKAQELNKYAANQWELLVSNDLAEDSEYLSVTKRAVESFARTLVQSESELIFALDPSGTVVMRTREVNPPAPERGVLRARAQNPVEGWQEITLEGAERVGQAFMFQPFEWFIFVTDTTEAFFAEVEEINRNTYMILGGSSAAAIILLLAFSAFLTGPLGRMVGLMSTITRTNDLSERVLVEYNDEIGKMAGTFNTMLGRLQDANDRIKGFALQAVVAQRKEVKIRNLFQKYVPADVIDTVFQNPEKALEGENRVLAILFSDIRSFTTISEGFMPDELVRYLNHYFDMLGSIITGRGGIIDKYIGDAIMAFFGAPVRHEDDALQAVMSALEMQKALMQINAEHKRAGKPPFKTGIGVNYGVVTVGNIGFEKKMDYTIIGDMVNYGSRLEGLTKEYQQDVILSESVFRKIKTSLPCRLVDKVQVKGKTKGENIYTTTLTQTERQARAWGYHHAGVKRYLLRQFDEAIRYFKAVETLLPGDHLAQMYTQRCLQYRKNPPPPDWTGLAIMKTK